MNSSITRIPFMKMQALGNDFVLIHKKDLQAPLSPTQVRTVADRKRGIGCDQVILINNVSSKGAEVLFYNGDGSEALACGNGTRCVAKYLRQDSGIIQTPSFSSQFWRKGDQVTISLKTPQFSPPLLLSSPLLKAYPIDVGNPHLVIFTDKLESLSLEELAPSLQPPEGVNVELAQVISPTMVKVKVWERGVGITTACGTGACAVGIMSLKLGFIEKSPIFIEMEGGLLEIEWEENSPLLLTGPADYSFEGIIELP